MFVVVVTRSGENRGLQIWRPGCEFEYRYVYSSYYVALLRLNE